MEPSLTNSSSINSKIDRIDEGTYVDLDLYVLLMNAACDIPFPGSRYDHAQAILHLLHPVSISTPSSQLPHSPPPPNPPLKPEFRSVFATEHVALLDDLFAGYEARLLAPDFPYLPPPLPDSEFASFQRGEQSLVSTLPNDSSSRLFNLITPLITSLLPSSSPTAAGTPALDEIQRDAVTIAFLQRATAHSRIWYTLMRTSEQAPSMLRTLFPYDTNSDDSLWLYLRELRIPNIITPGVAAANDDAHAQGTSESDYDRAYKLLMLTAYNGPTVNEITMRYHQTMSKLIEYVMRKLVPPPPTFTPRPKNWLARSRMPPQQSEQIILLARRFAELNGIEPPPEDQSSEGVADKTIYESICLGLVIWFGQHRHDVVETCFKGYLAGGNLLFTEHT